MVAVVSVADALLSDEVIADVVEVDSVLLTEESVVLDVVLPVETAV